MLVWKRHSGDGSRDLGADGGGGEQPVSGVVEYRPHADGTLQAEIRRYYRKDGSAKELGPYWYFRYHEGGKQKKIYLGRTDNPEAELSKKRKGGAPRPPEKPRLPGGDGRHRRRAPVSSAAACGLEGHAPTYGLGSSPGVVAGEQALLEGSRTRLPRGQILRLQGFQPSAFAVDFKPEEPRLLVLLRGRSHPTTDLHGALAGVVAEPRDVVGDGGGDVEGRGEPGVGGQAGDVEVRIVAGGVVLASGQQVECKAGDWAASSVRGNSRLVAGCPLETL